MLSARLPPLSYWLTPDGVVSAEEMTTPEPGDVQRWFGWQSDGYPTDPVDDSGRSVALTAAEERWLEAAGEERRERMEAEFEDFMQCGLEA